MEDTTKVAQSGVGKKIGTQFLIGILVVVPIAIVIWVLSILISLLDRMVQPLLQYVVGHPVSIVVSVVIALALIYLIGVIASNIGGKRLIGWGESLVFGKIPVVRQIYNGTKQVMQAFAAPKDNETRFTEVVFVEFPHKGMKTIALVTNESYQESGEKLLHIFIPTSPNPTSGYMEIIRECDVTHTDISVEEALKMVISAGKVVPEGLTKGLSFED